MPTYGDDKIKDIIEGILPATRNKAKSTAKNRKHLHREHRRKANQCIIAGDYDNVNAQDTFFRKRIHEMKWERRDADNLAALFRWARAITKHLDDPADRYMFIKKVLPDTMQGRHALGHIAYLDGFADPGANEFEYGLLPRGSRYREPKNKIDWIEVLTNVCNNGDLKNFNYHIKQHFIKCSARVRIYEKAPPGANASERSFRWMTIYNQHNDGSPCRCTPRTLLGVHDIASFMAHYRLTRYGTWHYKNKVTDWLAFKGYIPAQPELN